MPIVPVTEFEEIDVDELHLVGKAANGFPTLMLKATEERHDPGEGEKECPTCHGSGKIRDGHMTCPTCEGSGCVPEKDDAEKSVENRYPVTRDEWLAKRDMDPNVGGGVDRDKLPAEDFAGKNRSFPIVTPGDVSDAASSIGRAGPDNYSTDQLKANIIAIAKRKGPKFEAELPDSWKGDASKGTPPEADQKVTAALQKLKEALEEAISAQDDDNEGWESGKTQKDAAAAAKAGRRLSNKSVAALTTIRDHVNGLLGDDDPAKKKAKKKGDDKPSATLGPFTSKAQQEITDMTAEELEAVMAKALTAAMNDREKNAAKQARKAEKAEQRAAMTPEEIEAEKAAKAEKAAARKAEKAASLTKRLQEAIVKGVEETLRPLSDRLSTVEKMAAPGGPAKTRPQAALNKSAQRDALELKLAELEGRANNTSDREVRKGYLEKAEEVRKQIADLVA